MLSLQSGNGVCGRREFLKIGGLGLGGLALSDLLAARASAATKGPPIHDKSVVFLFLHGGPTQIETFDPKMDAPAEIRSITGEIDTAIPGVTFGGTMKKLSPLANKFSIVRSFTTGNANHDIKPIVCDQTMKANLGSLYSRIAGTNHPVTGMPTNVALFPRAVDPERQPAQEGFGKFNSTGMLGSAYAPFVPGGGGNMQRDMQMTLKQDRIDDRRSLLSGLDRLWQNFDSGLFTGMDRFQEQAFQTILGGVANAFDLSKEDPRTIERYDTAPLARPEAISRKWNNYNNYVDNSKTLGKLMLLARRLCEGGCGFVTVTTNFVWDMHADVNNATIDEGMQYMGNPLDHAVSTFIQDVAERGLSDKILLVVTGEMGRTPRINSKGGRDHWGGLAPLLLSGGGLKMGQVIGQSTKDAGLPLSEPYDINHLVSTIMHTLTDVGQLRLLQSIPADLNRLITNGTPIPGLI